MEVAFYSTALQASGCYNTKEGSELVLYIAQAVHKCEGESGGRADLLLSATDKERVQGKLKHGGGGG